MKILSGLLKADYSFLSVLVDLLDGRAKSSGFGGFGGLLDGKDGVSLNDPSVKKWQTTLPNRLGRQALEPEHKYNC